MKKVFFAVAAACALAAAPAWAEDAAPAAPAPEAAAATHFTTTESLIGDLLDNEAAKAVLEQHIPELINNPQIDMARAMTLKSIQAYAPDLTDDVLAAIDTDLANVH